MDRPDDRHVPTGVKAADATFRAGGLKWHRDLADLRDYTPATRRVRDMLSPLEPAADQGPAGDWRTVPDEWPSADDQGDLSTSAVHACSALLQYFERRAGVENPRPSRLFLYRTARSLAGLSGDSGTTIRATLKAMVRFGAPPEELWRYDPLLVDSPPDSVGYAYAYTDRCRDLVYVRLDAPEFRSGAPRRHVADAAGARPSCEAVLSAVKRALRAGIPCVFGFPVFSTVTRHPAIPFHAPEGSGRRVRLLGGQAVVAVAYDDDMVWYSSRGHLVIRTSWGTGWGHGGYGFLPYDFVTSGLACDFWTLLSPAWLPAAISADPFRSAGETGGGDGTAKPAGILQAAPASWDGPGP